MRKVQTGPHSWKWVMNPFDYIDDVIVYGIGTIIVLSIVACLYFVYWLATRPPAPSFTLKKDEWSCTQEHTGMLPIVQMVGKQTIITYMPTSKCVNYHRGGY